MVNTTKSDIVSPSVTTEDPLGFLSQEVFILNDVFANITVNARENLYQFIGSSTVGCANAEGIQPFLAGSLNVLRSFLVAAITDSTLVFRPSRIAF